MPYELKLEQFSGPLDLLLQLVEREQMSINDISLAHVADEYLRYLDTLDDGRIEELADFLVIAARLLVIKSRSLLPEMSIELEDGMSLADQLKMYKEFIRAAEVVRGIIKAKQTAFFRPFAFTQMQGRFFPPQSVTARMLCDVFQSVLDRLKPVVALPQTALARALSIADCISRLRALLTRTNSISFTHFIQSAGNRTDIIVSFLALLELIKQRHIVVSQGTLFEDITIEHYESARAV